MSNPTKYVHEYLTGKCNACGHTACFEIDERGDVMFDENNQPRKKSGLKKCSGCDAVQYCSKKCQREDWSKHKAFCKRMKTMIAEYKIVRDSRPHGSAKPKKATPYPLHDLIEDGDWRGLMKFLDDHPTYDVNQLDNAPQFMSPLILACGQGQIECVHILLNNGADVTHECAKESLTPLIYASWWGHDDIVRLLLAHGANVNQKNKHDCYALGYACSKLQPAVVELLLQHGADVDTRNFLGWTPLMSTVCMGSTPQEGQCDDYRSAYQRRMEDNPKIITIVNMLLEAGSDINARGHSSFGVIDFRGDTAINLAVDDDKLDIMQFLISKDASMDIQRESDGRNALLAAAENKYMKALDLLIRSGADITVRNNEGRDYRDLLALPNDHDE